jgi:hypothetical protein
MSTSSNCTKAFVQCCHGKHTVVSSRTLLSNHVYLILLFQGFWETSDFLLHHSSNIKTPLYCDKCCIPKWYSRISASQGDCLLSYLVVIISFKGLNLLISVPWSIILKVKMLVYHSTDLVDFSQKLLQDISIVKTNQVHFLYSVCYELMASTCFEHYLPIFRRCCTTIGSLRECYVCWLLPAPLQCW